MLSKFLFSSTALLGVAGSAVGVAYKYDWFNTEPQKTDEHVSRTAPLSVAQQELIAESVVPFIFLESDNKLSITTGAGIGEVDTTRVSFLESDKLNYLVVKLVNPQPTTNETPAQLTTGENRNFKCRLFVNGKSSEKSEEDASCQVYSIPQPTDINTDNSYTSLDSQQKKHKFLRDKFRVKAKSELQDASNSKYYQIILKHETLKKFSSDGYENLRVELVPTAGGATSENKYTIFTSCDLGTSDAENINLAKRISEDTSIKHAIVKVKTSTLALAEGTTIENNFVLEGVSGYKLSAIDDALATKSGITSAELQSSLSKAQDPITLSAAATDKYFILSAPSSTAFYASGNSDKEVDLTCPDQTCTGTLKVMMQKDIETVIRSASD